MSQSNYYQQWKQTANDLINYSKNSSHLQQNSTSEPTVQQTATSSAQAGHTATFFQHMNANKLASTLKQMPTTGLTQTIDGDAEMSDNDDEKNGKLQQIYEKAIGDNAKQQILQILEKVALLTPAERLLLYLRMPGGYPETDPLRQSQNPLGTRSEINHTINWVRSHLEHDPNVSIPKQEVYEDYVAYCARVDIKPLSTADFGKVMKQVFPGIRPRRLGTRGHSRYCYAAMRKATKLDPPKLPEIGKKSNNKNPEEDAILSESESWKIVKLWSESILTSSFDSVTDLASFISKNNLNSPSCIQSRQVLQKKLLQREQKEKKKMIAVAMKRRRSKRRKTLSSSIDTTGNNQPTTALTAQTVNATNVLQQVIKTESDLTDLDDSQTAINLKTFENDALQLQTQKSTNMNCDMTTNGVLLSNNDEPIEAAAVAAAIVKIEKTEEIILCKKVRQAQQTKQLLNAQNNNNINENHPINEKIFNPPSNTGKRLMSDQLQGRLKRLRQLQMHQAGIEEGDENEETDFPLPRERLISICNMDKTALDDYLNGEQNQDPDAELLQYFPEEDQQKSYDPNKASNSKSAPFLENYEFYGDDNNEQISQLRTILEQNITSNPTTEPMKKPSETIENLSQMNLPVGSAAASLAMLSQRHLYVRNDQKRVPNNSNRKLNIDIPYGINNNSSLHIRKNYNFVPISSDQHSPRVNVLKAQQSSTATSGDSFVSPRNTPIHKKQMNKTSLNLSQNGYPSYVKPELPASAPPSPLLVQNYRYGVSSMSGPFTPQLQLTHSSLNALAERSSSVPLIPNYNNVHVNFHNAAGEFFFPDQANPINLMTENNAVPATSIKIEENEFNLELLDQNADLYPTTKHNSSFNVMSRSVPSTPLPQMTFTSANTNCDNVNGKLMFDMSKSVPTTPIAVNPNLFRYSPKTSRDILISGEPYYQNTSQPTTGVTNSVENEMSTLTDPMDGLMEPDEIIGSDILNI